MPTLNILSGGEPFWNACERIPPVLENNKGHPSLFSLFKKTFQVQLSVLHTTIVVIYIYSTGWEEGINPAGCPLSMLAVYSASIVKVMSIVKINQSIHSFPSEIQCSNVIKIVIRFSLVWLLYKLISYSWANKECMLDRS